MCARVVRLSSSRRLPTSSGLRFDDPVTLPARSRKAGDESFCHRIRNRRENNGKGPGRLLGGQGRRFTSRGQDHINLEGNQFGCQSGSRSSFPSASLYSMTRLRPSTYPRSRSPCRKASCRWRFVSRLSARKPIRAILPAAASQRRAAPRRHQPSRSAGSGGGPLLYDLIRPRQ